MKKGLMSLLIVLGTLQAIAQDGRGHHIFQVIEENLELTAEQTVQLNELKSEVEALRNSPEFKQLPKEEKKVQMKDVQQRVKEILTADQLEKLKAVRKEHRQKRMEMRKEIKAYRTENIQPVLKAKREEFDQKLTEAEKSKIKEVKSQLEAIKGDQKRHEITPEQREQIKALVEQLKPIAKAHRVELKAIVAELGPLRAEWRSDLKAIHDKYGVPERGHKGTQEAKKTENGKKKGKKGKHLMRFLLMD
jgi:outer membrane protein OmpA-like peptidoglycan-associated protein